MQKIVSSVEELIGNTPLLELRRFGEAFGGFRARLLVKLESANPAGSAKDRVAKQMLDRAEREGLLTADSVIIEPTSGNTGIALCALGAARGLRVIVVMPSTASSERAALVRAYGAEVVLTDGALGMTGAIEEAKRLARSIPNSFIPSQFENAANPAAHYDTTGPEIWRDTEGHVDVLVCGIGTGGTISGTGRYLKEQNPDLVVLGVEPAESPVLSGPAGTKPRPHALQGMGAGFVPKTLDTGIYDKVISVTAEEAYRAARLLAQKEGVLVGISSGACLAVAAETALHEAYRGKTVVAILPDSGERYLSTALFAEDE